MIATSLVASTACQTLPKPKEIKLPATAETFFDSCQSGDGALTITARRGGETRATVQFEWAVQEGGGWAAEVYNPLGQTMLQIAYRTMPGRFDVGGRFAASLPTLDIDDDGYLSIDGYFVPIRPEEMPCLLKFKWPRDWLGSVVDYRQKSDGMSIAVVQEERQVALELFGISSLQDKRSCATVTWSHMLGMVKSKVRICQSDGPSPSATLEGLKDYELQWTHDHG